MSYSNSFCLNAFSVLSVAEFLYSLSNSKQNGYAITYGKDTLVKYVTVHEVNRVVALTHRFGHDVS